MAEAILDIKTWGNNLGVRLPAAIARAAHLHVNQRVKLSVVDGVVIIAPMLSTIAPSLKAPSSHHLFTNLQ